VGDREGRVAASQGGSESNGDMVRFSTKNKTTIEVDFGTRGRSLCVFVFQHKNNRRNGSWPITITGMTQILLLA
jgi:hypothetical protein